MGTNVRPNIVTNGLVLCLDAGNGQSYPRSGTTWGDLSGQANTGTLTNGPAFSATNQGTIVFDSIDDFVSIANTNTSLTFGTGNFTLECWFNTNGASQATNSTLMCIGNAGSTANWQLNFTSNVLVFYYNNVNVITTTYNATTGGWQQVVVVRSGTGTGATAIYLNKLVNVVGTAASNFTDTSVVKIGQNRGSNAYYGGNIAAARAYNRALSQQEVIQNYNATKNRFGLS